MNTMGYPARNGRTTFSTAFRFRFGSGCSWLENLNSHKNVVENWRNVFSGQNKRPWQQSNENFPRENMQILACHHDLAPVGFSGSLFYSHVFSITGSVRVLKLVKAFCGG